MPGTLKLSDMLKLAAGDALHNASTFEVDIHVRQCAGQTPSSKTQCWRSHCPHCKKRMFPSKLQRGETLEVLLCLLHFKNLHLEVLSSKVHRSVTVATLACCNGNSPMDFR